MKDCPYCKKELDDSAVKCKACGGWLEDDAEVKQNSLDQQQRDAKLEKLVVGKPKNVGQLIEADITYFYVPDSRLVILSILSFGLYELIWFYKNWKEISEKSETKMSPFWRSVFSVFFCFHFFKQIHASAENKGYHKKQSDGILAVVYIVILMTYRLPDPFSLISTFTFLPLLTINQAIKFNNHAIDGEQTVHPWHWSEIVLALLGGFLWVVGVLPYMLSVL